MDSEKVETLPGSVGLRIKQLRAYYRYNALDFSLKCELSPFVILKVEEGFSKPQKRTLEKIAEAFGTTINWLLYGEGDMLIEQAEPANRRSS